VAQRAAGGGRGAGLPKVPRNLVGVLEALQRRSVALRHATLQPAIEQRRDDEEQHQGGDDTNCDLNDESHVATAPKVVST
jgi:hypothetical protein